MKNDLDFYQETTSLFGKKPNFSFAVTAMSACVFLFTIALSQSA